MSIYEEDYCWCGMDHARVELDGEGNWVEIEKEDIE